MQQSGTVGFDLHARTNGVENPAAVGHFRSRVEPLLADAFAKMHPGPGDDAVYLSLEFDTRINTTLAAFTSLIRGASLAVVPTWDSYHYSLAATAELPGEPERKFSYATTLTTVYWVPLVFAQLVRTPQDVEDEVIDQLMLNLLVDLERPEGSAAGD